MKVGILALRFGWRPRGEEAVYDEDYEPAMPVDAFALVLNKGDLVHPKEQLLAKANELGTMAEACIIHHMEHLEESRKGLIEDIVPPVFYMNAQQGEGVDHIVSHLNAQATPCMVCWLGCGSKS